MVINSKSALLALVLPSITYAQGFITTAPVKSTACIPTTTAIIAPSTVFSTTRVEQPFPFVWTSTPQGFCGYTGPTTPPALSLSTLAPGQFWNDTANIVATACASTTVTTSADVVTASVLSFWCPGSPCTITVTASGACSATSSASVSTATTTATLTSGSSDMTSSGLPTVVVTGSTTTRTLLTNFTNSVPDRTSFPVSVSSSSFQRYTTPTESSALASSSSTDTNSFVVQTTMPTSSGSTTTKTSTVVASITSGAASVTSAPASSSTVTTFAGEAASMSGKGRMAGAVAVLAGLAAWGVVA